MFKLRTRLKINASYAHSFFRRLNYRKDFVLGWHQDTLTVVRVEEIGLQKNELEVFSY